MPKQVNDILGQILLVVFFAVMVVTPLLILVLGIVNFRRDSLRQARSILQALAIWACLTFILIMVFIMVTFQFPAYVSQANELMGTVIFIGGSLIYALVGGALIYWTKRQTKRMPAMGVSC